MAVHHHSCPQSSSDEKFHRALSSAQERTIRLLLRVANDINDFNANVLSSGTKQDALDLKNLYQKYKRPT